MLITNQTVNELIERFSKADERDIVKVFKPLQGFEFEEINCNTSKVITLLDTSNPATYNRQRFYIMFYNAKLKYCGLEEISFYTNIYYYNLFVTDDSEMAEDLDDDFWKMPDMDKFKDLKLIDNSDCSKCNDMMGYMRIIMTDFDVDLDVL
jgi:hypothetical protein